MATSTEAKNKNDADAPVVETPAKKTRAPRTSSSFEIVKETPPPAPNSVSGGQLYRALEQIAETPGEWFRVAECNSRSGANSIWSTIKKETRRTPFPKEQYEFTARIDKEGNTSKLYARFVGEGTSE